MSNLPRPSKDTGWRLFMRTMVARAYPRVIGQQRQRWWMFFEVTLPLVGLSAYVFVYRAIGAPAEFVGFVILGGAMSAFWLNVLWAMANQLYNEKQTGNLPLYIIAPNSLMAILLGMALGGMFATALRAAAILVLGSWLFDVKFTVTDGWALAGVFVLALGALYGMGMMCASLFLLYGREAWHLVHAAQEPVYLASGLYFPVNTLPRVIAIAASVIPLTLALDAIRQLVLPSGAADGWLPVRVEMGVLLLLAFVFTAAARVLLIYMERLARHEGRLTEAHG
jgi:ABC-2 type transport system permease protein